jgi:hypothetical protein
MADSTEEANGEVLHTSESAFFNFQPSFSLALLFDGGLGGVGSYHLCVMDPASTELDDRSGLPDKARCKEIVMSVRERRGRG